MGTVSKKDADTVAGNSIDEAASNFGRTLEEAGSAHLVDESGDTIGTAKSGTATSPRGSIDVSDQSDLERVIAGANAEARSHTSPRGYARGTVAGTVRSASPAPGRETLAHQVERAMAGVPTATWIALAGVSLIGSFALRVFGRRATANLFSGWAPMFLVAGLYNKLTTVGAATALLSARR